VVNGGFGLLLDGSAESQKRLENMLFWDVNNGVARRSWARNPGAIAAIEEAMRVEPRLLVTKAHLADPALVEKALGNIE
jgi:urocanate hydratase